MNRKRCFGWAAGAVAAMGLVSMVVLVSAAPSTDDEEKAKYERLRQLSYELMKIEPLIHRIEEMEDLVYSVKATSHTLEQLEALEIKAGSVERLNAILARMDRIEPILASLEEMQRDFTERRRKATGIAAKRPEKWSAIFDQFQARLAALETRTFAPAVLRNPAAARTPIELRLEELETRQNELAKENEELRTELRRLRRAQQTRLP